MAQERVISPTLVADLVEAEIRAGVARYGEDYASAHEAFAVLLEEVEEFKEWVWKRQSQRDAQSMAMELVQVAAVAQRYAEQLLRKGVTR